MPQHPEAVQDIRSAFRRGAMSRAEAAQLLRAEGLSETVINATLVPLGALPASVSGLGQADPFTQGLTTTPNLGFPLPPSTAPGEPSPTGPNLPVQIINPTGGPGGGPTFVDPDPVPTQPTETPEERNRRIALAEAERRRLEDELRRREEEERAGVPIGGAPPGGGGGLGDPVNIPADLGVDALTPLQQLQIEQSATRGGRGTLFDQFRAGQPLQSLLAQRVQQRQFNPLSAIFGLLRAQNPETPSNFATFLNNRGGSPVGPLGFQGSFQNLANIFQPGATSQETERRQSQAQAFEDPSDPNFARNAIIQGFVSQFAGLPGAAARAAGRRIDQFQSTNEGIPLFQAFLEGLLGQGGGGFFGGFQQ